MTRMEPMTLGSPTHSPSGSPGPNFLPPFLMGEFHQPITPRAGSLSPTKARTLAFANSPARPAPHYSTPLQQKQANNISFSNKANGPPTQGLFDSLHQSDWNAKQAQSPTTPFNSPTQANYYQSPENVIGLNDSQNINQAYSHYTAQKHNQSLINESYSHNPYISPEATCYMGDEENEYWITVFGFPANAANMILTQFSNCGNIIEKKFPSQGNWVWLRFTSRTEAGRALALNGRVLPGGMMIGVMACNQPPNSNNLNASLVSRSGARQLAVGPPRLQNVSAVSPTPSTAGAQRSSGAISRALEYVFGW